MFQTKRLLTITMIYDKRQKLSYISETTDKIGKILKHKQLFTNPLEK